MKTIKHKGVVENGKLKLYDEPMFKDYVSLLDGEVDVIVEKHKDTRSLKANAFYWGVIITAISEESGNDIMADHYEMKKRFLPKLTATYTNKLTGEERTEETVGSTRKLKSDEFAKYNEKVMAWASMYLGIVWDLN